MEKYINPLYDKQMKNGDQNIGWVDISCDNNKIFLMQYEANEIISSVEDIIDVSIEKPVSDKCTNCKQNVCSLLELNLKDLAFENHKVFYLDDSEKIDFSEFGKPNEREKAYLKDLKIRKPDFFEKLRNNIVFNGDEISFFVKGNFSGEKDWITLKKVNLEEKKLLDEDDRYRIPTETDLNILNSIFGSFSNDNEDFKEFFEIFGIKEEGYGNNFYKFQGEIHFQANNLMENYHNFKYKEAFLLYVSYG